jgi:rhodanese-related sulfurtransferase
VSAPVTVDAATLRERLAGPNPPRLLDVRTPAEFAALRIPGAYNVPLDLLREHRGELRRHLDTDVVLVCRSGQRAEQAERTLAGAGLTGVHVLAGGMNGWQADGAPVNRGRGTWDLERQVRLTAGALVLLGVLSSLVVPGPQWFSAAVGAGLVVAALTGTCAMGALLARLPWNRAASCDLDRVVAQLTRGR